MNETHASIRELKTRLSHYLRLAKKGEAVVITERGTPIGRIVPMGQDLHERLTNLCEAGQAQWSGRKPSPRIPLATISAPSTVAQILVDARE